MPSLLVALAVLAVIGHAASAPLSRVQILQTKVIEVDIDTIWNFMGDFGNVTWYGIVEDTQIVSGIDNQPGAVRQITFNGGSQQTERLTSYQIESTLLAVNARSYTYDIVQGAPAFPGSMLNGHASTVWKSVMGPTNNSTFIEWRLEFDTESANQDAMYKYLSGGLAGGLLTVCENFDATCI
eukprot:TRINITY_DN1357_c0_g1_i2.p1 TRINITY_DN1357_c0_g1~~TRINITY_DN1357_c0_g1_i2.p1  ORF type:complete len:182 (+),score=19.08 TRINITY_DN1357_c0_g1_i2:34-579(+)